MRVVPRAAKATIPSGYPRGFFVKSLDTATKGEYNIKNAGELFWKRIANRTRGGGRRHENKIPCHPLCYRRRGVVRCECALFQGYVGAGATHHDGGVFVPGRRNRAVRLRHRLESGRQSPFRGAVDKKRTAIHNCNGCS